VISDNCLKPKYKVYYNICSKFSPLPKTLALMILPLRGSTSSTSHVTVMWSITPHWHKGRRSQRRCSANYLFYSCQEAQIRHDVRKLNCCAEQLKFCQEAWKREKRSKLSEIFLQNTSIILLGRDLELFKDIALENPFLS